MILVSCLFLLPSSLITCSILLFLSLLILSRFQYHSKSDPPLPPIHSWYPYILSLFAGSLCVRVQHTYTSTLIPKRPISFPLCIRPMSPLSPLNISSFHSQLTCHVCVAVGFFRAITSSLSRILSDPLQRSCPHNYVFLYPTTLIFTAILSCFPSLAQSRLLRCPSVGECTSPAAAFPY